MLRTAGSRMVRLPAGRGASCNRSGDRIDVSPLLPGFDDTQDLSDKSVSGTTVTFRVEGASVIQALDPSVGELTGLTVDQLHDQGILLA